MPRTTPASAGVSPFRIAPRESLLAPGLLGQVLINGISGNWDSAKKPVTGKPTYQDLGVQF
jgi:hypothetical protein